MPDVVTSRYGTRNAIERRERGPAFILIGGSPSHRSRVGPLAKSSSDRFATVAAWRRGR